MLILGEIADKMPTISDMWAFMLFCSCVFLLIGVWTWWLRIAVFAIVAPASIWWAWANYQMAFYDFDAQDIQYELGTVWIIHSIAIALLPAIAVSLLIVLQIILHKRKSISPRLCASA